jgi:hypothetical protein
MTNSEMHAVDDLLKSTAAAARKGVSAPIPEERDEVTGVYDLRFFESHDRKPASALDHLADARVGLGLFLEETTRALEVNSNELTPDQRVHVATIASYIEALMARFDRIRVPGYVQKVAKVPR